MESLKREMHETRSKTKLLGTAERKRQILGIPKGPASRGLSSKKEKTGFWDCPMRKTIILYS